MSIINNKLVSNQTIHNTLQSIDKCIRVASSFGGKIFGGYVRDVVVPRMKDPYCNVNFNNVDIWFISQESADNFTKSFDEIIINFLTKCLLTINNKIVSVVPYLLKIDNRYIDFRVIINPLLPVDDMNVNKLIYYYQNDIGILTSDDSDATTLLNLRDSINDKTMIMFDDYINKVTTNSVHINRINRFLSLGWTIKTSDGLIFPNCINDVWVKDILVKNIKGFEKPKKMLDELRKAEEEVKQAIEKRNKILCECVKDKELNDKFITLLMDERPEIVDKMVLTMLNSCK